MPIPHDQLGRWWIEISAANPARVNELRPSLLAVLGFGPNQEPHLVGSAFIVAGGREFALVITARHVLVDGVREVQRPLPKFNASALFIPPSALNPTLHPKKLKVVWMDSHHAMMMNVVHANFNDTTDLACGVIAPQPDDHTPFVPINIPLDTGLVRVGDLIHMVSLDDLSVSELTPPIDASGRGQHAQVGRRVSLRVGVVTGVHDDGFRQYRWPCFTTSIPAKPGMSGGFVMLPVHGKTIAAIGVVCADNSSLESHSSFLQCGESIVAYAWPALALRAPTYLSNEGNGPTHTLYRFMVEGKLPAAVGGISQIKLREDSNGDCVIGYGV